MKMERHGSYKNCATDHMIAAPINFKITEGIIKFTFQKVKDPSNHTTHHDYHFEITIDELTAMIAALSKSINSTNVNQIGDKLAPFAMDLARLHQVSLCLPH